MAQIEHFLISTSGQMSSPAAAQRRWGLTKGGSVDVLDLGFGVLTVPAGTGPALLTDLLSREAHVAFVADIDDPELATT